MPSSFDSLRAHIERKRPLWIAAECVAVFALHLLLFRISYVFDLVPLGFDGYYHYVMAELHGVGELAKDVDFFPYTYMADNYTNHHWLFHWLVKPLTFLPEDSEHSIKNAALVWGAVLPALINAVLRILRVPFAPVFASLSIWMLPLLPERFLMFRAQNLGLVFLIALNALIVYRRYWALALVLFFFNHAYQAVVLVAFVGVAGLMLGWLRDSAIDRKLIVFSIAGVGLSMLLSPWFPKNIEFFIFHILLVVHDPYDALLLNGLEWRSVGLTSLVQHTYPSLVAIIFSFALLIRYRALRSSNRSYQLLFVFCLFTLMMLVMQMRHIRFVELYGPISVISAAFGFKLLLEQEKFRARWVALPIAIWAMTIPLQVQPKRMEGIARMEDMQAHCQYLQENLNPGQLIFNGSKIDSFVKLVKCVPEVKFVSGLNAKILAHGDQEVFWAWYGLYTGDPVGNRSAEEAYKQTRVLFERIQVDYVYLEGDDKIGREFMLAAIPEIEIVVADEAGMLLFIN